MTNVRAATVPGCVLRPRATGPSAAGAWGQPHAHDLVGTGAPGRLIDELAGGLIDQRDRGGRGPEHAGGGVYDGLHQAARGAGILDRDRERDAGLGPQWRTQRLGEG